MADSAMQLFETRAQRVVPFTPQGDIVRIYTCGITPYDAAHVGHAATFLAYDVLQRRLRDLGYDTRCVRNITDVDDDILERAAQLQVHYLDVAAAALNTFEKDMAALGLLPAWSEPRATSAIADVRAFIGRVLDSGHAYMAQGSVFFNVSAQDDFGEVSRLSTDEMIELSRATQRQLPGRRHPLDFVLWQPAAPGEPSWTSRWGDGRPGWHVECAALSVRELGVPIDIHGGGDDLKYPHHECEQAQAEAATGERFVTHWMHTANVQMGGEKMAKSTGNLAFVADLREDHDPMAIRLAILNHHYRSPWEWCDVKLATADRCVERWRASGDGDGALDAVRVALDNDLDTPLAIEAIDEAVNGGQAVSRAAHLLGIV